MAPGHSYWYTDVYSSGHMLIKLVYFYMASAKDWDVGTGPILFVVRSVGKGDRRVRCRCGACPVNVLFASLVQMPSSQCSVSPLRKNSRLAHSI